MGEYVPIKSLIKFTPNRGQLIIMRLLGNFKNIFLPGQNRGTCEICIQLFLAMWTESSITASL